MISQTILVKLVLGGVLERSHSWWCLIRIGAVVVHCRIQLKDCAAFAGDQSANLMKSN